MLLLCGVLAWGRGQRDDLEILNVYSHRHYDVDRIIYQRFKERTGIQINLIQADSNALIERMRAEGTDSPADILITVDVGRLTRAKRLGLLQPIDATGLTEAIPAHLRDGEGYWFGLTKRARVIVYHTERVDPTQLSTYEDLTDPRWHGRVLVRTSQNIYNISLLASMIAHNIDARQWATGMVANMARIPQGNDRDQIKAIAAGIGDVALVNTYYIGLLLHSDDPAEREAGALVGILFPNQQGRGTHVNISGAGVARYANNVANATALLEFFIEPEIQRLLASANYEYPVVENVADASSVAAWGPFREDRIPLELLGDRTIEAVTIFDEAGWR